MIVLGIDTGSSETAYARIRLGERGAEFEGCGIVESTRAVLRGVLEMTHDRLAIEKHGLVFRVGGASHMVQSSDVAGMVYGLSTLDEDYIQRITAVDWRTEIGLGRNPSNAQVKEVVTGNVRDWPKRSNEHERDACGVALAALWRIRTRRSPCTTTLDVTCKQVIK